MLVVSLDFGRIARQQETYSGRGTMRARDRGVALMLLRKAFEHDADRFNERQERNDYSGRPVLGDGRLETLSRYVLPSPPSLPWAARAGAMLRGLRLDRTTALPLGPPRWPEAAAESWFGRLDDGPEGERDFPAMTSIACYFDPFQELRILWIGHEEDFDAALRDLEQETLQWQEWWSIHSRFDKWLHTGRPTPGSH